MVVSCFIYSGAIVNRPRYRDLLQRNATLVEGGWVEVGHRHEATESRRSTTTISQHGVVLLISDTKHSGHSGNIASKRRSAKEHVALWRFGKIGLKVSVR